MSDPVCVLMFRGLVKQAGGVEAAAAILEQAWGAASKGTVSKMCAGQAALTLDAVVALEEALGVYPISTRLFERVSAGPGASSGDLRSMAAILARDSGSAVSELVMAFSQASADPERLTEEERARVNVLARRLREDCRGVIRATDAAPGAVAPVMRSV